MQEIAERAHHVQALAPRQAVENPGQLGAHGAGLARLRTPKAHRGLAHALYQCIAGLSSALLQYPAQEPSEQADVFAQFRIQIDFVVQFEELTSKHENPV